MLQRELFLLLIDLLPALPFGHQDLEGDVFPLQVLHQTRVKDVLQNAVDLGVPGTMGLKMANKPSLPARYTYFLNLEDHPGKCS